MTRRDWAVAGLLAGAVAIAHGGAANGTFHYDDKVSITENLAIRQWQPWFYLTSPYAGTSEPGAAGYRPLTVATFAINYAIGGLEPSGYLLGNLLVHLVTSWLVFVVGRHLIRDDRWAAFAALVYALHPVNAEAVNYAVARSSLLAACGALLACWAFFRRQAGGGSWWTAAGLTAFAAALLSKESAVAVIVPLAAVQLTGASGLPARRSPLRDGLRSITPYAAVLVAYVAVWWVVAGTHVEQRGRTAAYPVWTFLELVGRSLLLWLWPHPLGLDHPLVFTTRFEAATAVWLVLGLGAFVALGAVCWRRRPMVSWCVVWALAGLAPLAPLPWMTVKGLMQENRLAFSAVGLAWLTAIAVREAVARAGGISARSDAVRIQRVLRALAAVTAAGALTAAVWLDQTRSAVWADDVRLWREVVARSPDNRAAYTNLGAAYMARNDYERAEDAIRKAVAVSPNDAFPYYALGLLAFRQGRYDDARLLFLKTASLAPEYAKTYRMLGIIAIRQDRDEDATRLLERALALDPRDAAALANLGLVAQRAGNDASAMHRYQDALALDPAQTLARNNLGALYLKQQRWADALEQFTRLLAHAPDDPDAALNRAAALNALGRRDEARAALQDLLARLPPDPRFDAHRRGASLILNRLTP